MKEFIGNFLKGNAKAIVAFGVTIFLAQLAKRGLTVDTNLQNAIEVILMACVTSSAVWLIPNKTQS